MLKMMAAKILVIEDNLEVRENIAELLQLSGYEVATAQNGKEGVQHALRAAPDLILCDVMMPELDGFGVLHILSKREETAHVPFVFLTAKTDKADFRKGMNLGADDYITKPFDDVELLDAIEMRLQKNSRSKAISNGMSFINETKSKELLEALVAQHEPHRYHKKDLIYEEGDYPKRLFVVRSGKVKTFKTNEEGKELLLDIFTEKHFFGYACAMQGTPHTESAAALEDAEVVGIPREALLALLAEDQGVANFFTGLLSEHASNKEARLIRLAYDSVRRRIAETLLLLHERFDGGEIAILREDLASMVGTAKETVIRTLADFKSERLIEVENTRIIVLDKERLARMPN
jgi:CRP-like cAMP-binding protein/CheY-like chemotaxis protein